MTRVNVLGCGPAGLFAVHAAVQMGADVRVFSKPRKSHMNGAQYLHRPIPGLSGEPFEIEYALKGSAVGYRDKVYGANSNVQVSPETLVGQSKAWDIREAYDAAWDEYGDLVNDWDVEFADMRPGRNMNLPLADLTISTIPAKLLCGNYYQDQRLFEGGASCRFESQIVWSTDTIRPALRRLMFEEDDRGGMRDNLVVCSGDAQDWWYRASRIQGWENTEFDFDHKPAYDNGVWRVEKPIRTDCDCHTNVVRMGRYGAWKKGVLSDSAYYDTEQLILNYEANNAANEVNGDLMHKLLRGEGNPLW